MARMKGLQSHAGHMKSKQWFKLERRIVEEHRDYEIDVANAVTVSPTASYQQRTLNSN
jgi:hypothetical protein